MIRFLRQLIFRLHSRRLADELREEIETHRSLRQAALERAGVADATAASRRALGNEALARDEARDVWRWGWLDDLMRDVRFACRTLWRQPSFAVVAILTLAVGTGTLASVLSVVHTVLLRPAPYPNADRIVQIGQVVNGRTRPEVATVDVAALRESSPSFSHVTIAWFSEASLSGNGLPERARRVYTDWQAFHLLGVRPLFGRLPTPADETPDAEPVVVIGHRIWTDRFASAPDAVGRTLRIDGQPYTVIAVMPAGFRFPAPYWSAGDLWLLRGPTHPSWPNSRFRIVLAFGLLREGATIERAQAEADVVAAALDARYPDANGPIGLRVTTWAETVRAGARPLLLFILGAAGLVFLIVCVNVANLLLSRGLERQRELAARVALGAGRARLVRQMLAETGVLFVLGGAAGILGAVWGSRFLVAFRSYAIPRMEEATVDGSVTALAMGITLAAATIVGVVPAAQAATARISDLTCGARGSSRGRQWRAFQHTLVAGEIGLALVLLCGAAVLVEGARKLARVDPGFDVSGLLHARVSLPPEEYRTVEGQAEFYDRVLARLLEIPGVAAAGAVNVPPGVGGSGRSSVWLDGDPWPSSARGLRSADVRVVSAGYLQTLGLSPRAGRLFSAADSPTVPVAIVNETFARRYFGASAIGKTLRVTFGGPDELDRDARTVVGVVPDIMEKTLYEPPPPTVYVPIATLNTWRVGIRMALLVRSHRPSGDLVPAIKRAIAKVDEEQAAHGFMPMDDLMKSELSLNRLNLTLLGALSTVALFLAAIGVYGVTAHAVRQRTRELGIRLALGVSRGGLLRVLLRDGIALIALGLVCGSLAAIWSAGLLRSLVHGIDSTSPGTFLLATLVLSGAVLAGVYFPARRATRIDPVAVLRAE